MNLMCYDFGIISLSLTSVMLFNSLKCVFFFSSLFLLLVGYILYSVSLTVCIVCSFRFVSFQLSSVYSLFTINNGLLLYICCSIHTILFSSLFFLPNIYLYVYGAFIFATFCSICFIYCTQLCT